MWCCRKQGPIAPIPHQGRVLFEVKRATACGRFRQEHGRLNIVLAPESSQIALPATAVGAQRGCL
eukprot:2504462-Pleurochrysis_carterae.AAC.1